MRRVFSICALVVSLAASSAAQQAPPPTRPYRGLFGGGPPADPNRNRHELTLSASVQAGYDDYVIPTYTGTAVDPSQVGESAYTGFADASLRYYYGRAARSFSTDLRAFSTTYAGAGVDPSVGGDLQLSFNSDLGARQRVNLSQTVAYEPSLVLGTFTTLASDVDSRLLPESGAGNGFLQRSWSTATIGSIDRNWTPRQTTTVRGSGSRRNYIDELGIDSRAYDAGIRHTWSISRTGSIGGVYTYSDSKLLTDAGSAPIRNHLIEFTAGYTRRISPTRQIQFDWGGGATHVDSTEGADLQQHSYWLPSAHATFRVDVGRTWAVAADYRRSATVLQGVTLQTFGTNAFSLRADGAFNRRIQAAASAAYADGRAGVADEPGSFRSYSVLGQVQFALARMYAVSVNYDYYYYTLRSIADLPPGFPPQYDRNAIRVGLAIWLPLYGAQGGGAEVPVRGVR